MKPRWYQEESTAAVWNHLCTEQGSPVVVLPTGAGKSLVIAMLCRDAVQRFNGRVIVLAHRKELLQQNAEKIRALLPDMDVGIYSAGLNSRDTDHDIVLAGIQSVYERAGEFGSRQMIIIDEVHLVPSDGEGMYKTFLGKMREINQRIRMVGLTATPFRTGSGKLCRSDALFQKVCYDVPIRRLINEGFLSNLITTKADATVDTSKLHIRAGEFVTNEMVALFDDAVKIKLASAELVEKTKDRKSTLIFCSGVHHAEEVAKEVERLTSEECGVVIGDTPPIERAALLRRFKSGELKRLCNCDVLTTGFDAPGIDAIVVLRATASPGLFAQMCGRGLRTAEGKQDCLVLDFGSNVKRHGPLDHPEYGHQAKGGGGGNGDAPTKVCPNCEEELPLSARECECGYEFPRQMARHETQAGSEEVLSGNEPVVELVVDEMSMARHRKKGGTPDDPDTLRIDYICHDVEDVGNMTGQRVSEWVCLEHEGYARTKAQKWWLERCLVLPEDIDHAIELWERGAVATPTAIRTKRDGRWLRVVGYDLDPIPSKDEWRDNAGEDDEAEVVDDWAVTEDVPF